ncbi:MAG: lysophospholipid acyltransferase family protein [Planctomycetaceae bacterium]|jgi:KDO2-lipid IV(A) lauroyltransferase|nr:lysophospholipid acyltransferase family protein [Planctomycetaceae bacterium]
MKRLLDYFIYLFVRVLICITQSLSPETGFFLARQFAFFFTHILPIRRRLIRENLAVAFPKLPHDERETLVYRMWEHLFLLVIEVAHIPRRIHATNWRDYIELVNTDKVGKVLHNDRPLIMVTGHFGNFEAGGYLLGILGYPSYSVARKLDNPYLDKFIRTFREASGQFLIPKNDGYDQILKVLERRDLMAFLVDQSAGPKGCWVDFFGKPASTYKAIALLSLQYDAPIVVCYAARRDNHPLHFEMTIADMLDPHEHVEALTVKEITQWYTHVLEDGIRRHPEQYWWVHRRWKDYPKGERMRKTNSNSQ